jgi:SAM-dependent methyltransferase
MSVEKQKEIRYSRQILAFQKIIRQHKMDDPMQRLLVLGCGNGLEAGYMSRLLGVEVFGVDIGQEFHPFGWMHANLRNYDGEHLPFPDGHFDAIYSYHVLEHVKDVPHMLSEIRRVLQSHGFVYIGVPNKSRLFGYVGMNDKSLYRKIRQNVKDWLKRLRGEWENALGAHAGFDEQELKLLLSEHFNQTIPVSADYYTSKWRKHERMIKLLSTWSVDKFFMPSVYMLAFNNFAEIDPKRADKPRGLEVYDFVAL